MIYKRGKWYWMDIMVNEVRYREPLKTKNWQEAKSKEKDRLLEVAQGKTGMRGPTAKQTFEAAADGYIEDRGLRSAEKSCRTDKERSQPLRKSFGNLPLKKITANGIAEYQKNRKDAGLSGRTINLEVGLLRRILKKNKQWARIADEVQMLPEHPKEARVLTTQEKAKLMETAAGRPEWQVARCAATLALNTTMRSCEIRGLRWKDIDWRNLTLSIRRLSTKTNAGVRTLPLNADALTALLELQERAEKLKTDSPEHYVLPSCEHGNLDATKPMKNWRTAWRRLCKEAGLDGLRFHDLRHHAITELAENGLSDQTIMSIAGHVSREMLNHYSHIRLDAKRKALDSLQTTTSATSVTSQSASQNEKPAEAGSPSDSFEMGPTGLEPMTSCV
jgi:integrase